MAFTVVFGAGAVKTDEREESGHDDAFAVVE